MPANAPSSIAMTMHRAPTIVRQFLISVPLRWNANGPGAHGSEDCSIARRPSGLVFQVVPPSFHGSGRTGRRSSGKRDSARTAGEPLVSPKAVPSPQRNPRQHWRGPYITLPHRGSGGPPTAGGPEPPDDGRKNEGRREEGREFGDRRHDNTSVVLGPGLRPSRGTHGEKDEGVAPELPDRHGPPQVLVGGDPENRGVRRLVGEWIIE